LKRALILFVLALAAMPLQAAGKGKRPADPEIPQLGVHLNGQRELTLDQAVAIARANDPNLVLTRLDSERQKGVAQEAGGLFDSSFETVLNAEWLRGELLPPVQNQQFTQRDIFNKFATIFQRVSDDLIRNLNEDPDFDTIPCSDALPEGSEIVIIDENGNEIIIRCTPSDEPTAIEDIFGVIIGSENTSQELRDALEAYTNSTKTDSRAEIEKIAALLGQQAANFREQLRLFGAVPFMEERVAFTLATGYRFNLRNGASVTPAIGVETKEENFVAKPQDPTRGGKGPAQFRTAVGLDFNLPLARGRGAGVADALERSAQLNYTASLAGVKHAETQTVLNTALAYWNLLAAQTSVREAEEAMQRSEQLLESGTALADGGEIARADVNQIQAIAGDNRRTWLDARLALRQAQLALASTIGLKVERPEDFPVATGELPALVSPETLRAIPVESLISEALLRRSDISEAYGRVDAASSLTYATRKLLAPKVDLNLFLFYQSTSANFSYLDGLEDAILGNWVGPSATLTLNMEVPVKNLTQIGQYRQALSLQRQGEIQARDLQRGIRGRVVELWGALIEAAETAERFANAERMYREALAGEQDRFEKGEGTTFDSLFLQEQLASAQLTLVRARLNFASLLAQLRFETGTIADPEFGDTMADVLGTPPAVADMPKQETDSVSTLATDLKNQNEGRLPGTGATSRR
jgi:outer membrane protein